MAVVLHEELDQTRYTHPQTNIFLADKLTDFRDGFGGEWSPHLYLDSLQLRAGPEVDHATLTYQTGYKINLGKTQFTAATELPSAFKNKAIKIRIGHSWESDHIVWFGIIDTVTSSGASQGAITVQATGVLQLLDKAHVRSAYSLNHDGTEVLRTGVGRPFNLDGDDFFGVMGNRSDSLQHDPVDHYVFSYENRGRTKWTTQTAVQYLLARHAPTDAAGIAVPPWIIDPETLAAPPGDWYDTRQETHGKTVLELLNQLIPRSRALSYYVRYDDTQQKCVLRMFTFVKDRLEISNEYATPRYLEANPHQVTVELDQSIWFTDDSSIIESSDQQYDAVVAYGERCTSTCTLGFDSALNHFIPDWSSEDEAAYKTAASTTDKKANATFRTADRYAHVYSRFRISDEWNGRGIPFGDDEESEVEYWVDPLLNPAGVPLQPYHASTNPLANPLRVRGIKIVHKTPLMDRIDYEDDNLNSLAVQAQIQSAVTAGDGASEYLDPFVFWHDTVDDRYIPVDQIPTVTMGDTDATKRRNFAVGCHFVPNEPSLRLTVGSKHQPFIARTRFVGADGVYDDKWDPVKNKGIDFTSFVVTLCIEFEHCLTVRQKIRDPQPGMAERVLEIDAKDARLDYLVPKTIVGLNQGNLLRSNGGYLRDDRERVKAVVRATAEWVGRPKNAATFAYKQVRKLVEIGDLVTSLDGIGLITDINTPVTGITYMMPQGDTGGITKVETGFAEIDFT